MRFVLGLMLMLAVACTGEVDPSPGPGDTSSPSGDVATSDAHVTADVSPTCVDRETLFQGHCYLATGLSSMDYTTALSTCAAIGAKPTSIHSQEENDFIFGLLFHMTRSAWIGLKRSGGSHTWEDGTAFQYKNWDSGEPDSSACIIMRGPLSDQASHGKWADTSCSSKYREVVCKRKP